MNAIERLEQQLDERDSRIEELERELEQRDEDNNSDRWKWTRQSKPEESDLPVPRLEIRCVNYTDEPDWYNYSWEYLLIYRHLLGHLVGVPLGNTTCSGNGAPVFNGQIHLPFRDGAHIAHDSVTLSLPAFAICEDRIETVSMEDGKIKQAALTHPLTPSVRN